MCHRSLKLFQYLISHLFNLSAPLLTNPKVMYISYILFFHGRIFFVYLITLLLSLLIKGLIIHYVLCPFYILIHNFYCVILRGLMNTKIVLFFEIRKKLIKPICNSQYLPKLRIFFFLLYVNKDFFHRMLLETLNKCNLVESFSSNYLQKF